MRAEFLRLEHSLLQDFVPEFLHFPVDDGIASFGVHGRTVAHPFMQVRREEFPLLMTGAEDFIHSLHPRQGHSKHEVHAHGYEVLQLIGTALRLVYEGGLVLILAKVVIALVNGEDARSEREWIHRELLPWLHQLALNAIDGFLDVSQEQLLQSLICHSRLINDHVDH